MKNFLFLIFILSFSLSVYSQEKTVQKSDSLYDVTSLRPADLILNASDLNFFSIDMYTYNINSGLYGNYGPQPDILLDGIPVDVNFFGWQNLNMLPVYLPNVKKVESNANPGLYKEEFYPAGMYDFINQMPPKGLNFKGTIYLGNESGDPGPWIYDSSRVTPNVDRWGPDAGTIISTRKNNWYNRIILMQRRHQQTDPISNRRLQRTMRDLGGTQPYYPIQTISESGLFETGFRSNIWDLKARLIIASDQNYLFLHPFGREIPSEAYYEQFALNTSYHSDQWKVGVRYILADKKLNRLINDHESIFDWKQITHSFKSFASYSYREFVLRGSINFEHNKPTAPGLHEEYYSMSGLNFSTRWNKNRETNYQISAGINFHRKQTAKNIKFKYNRYLNDEWYISLHAFYSEILPIKQQSFGYWITQGYNFYEDLEIPVSSPLIISNNKLADYQFLNRFDISERITLSLSQQLTHHYTLNIPWQVVNYNIETGSTPGSFNVFQGKGTRISLITNAEHQPLEWLQQLIRITFQSTLQGSDNYQEYFRQIPSTQIRYQINIAPVENIEMSLKGYYRSSSRWKEFDALDGKEFRGVNELYPVFTGEYNSTVPSHINIEAGVQKFFWDKKLSLQFSIENLLNDETRLHPMGADRSLLFNIKAVADF